MNWYRFNVELIAWAVKVVLCVVSAMALRYALLIDGFLMLSGPGSWIAAYPDMLRIIVIALVAFIWGMYLWAMRIVRSDRRYGTR